MPSDRHSGYVRLMAEHIAPMLPENPALARRVLFHLEGSLARPSLFWTRAVAAAAIVSMITVAVRQNAAEAETGLHARIVQAVDGINYVVIYDHVAGAPYKVRHRAQITPAEAAQRLKTPGWQREALAGFNPL
jgi:hypothetical protein